MEEEDGRGGLRAYVQMIIRTRVKYVPVTKFYSKRYISVVLCAVCVQLCAVMWNLPYTYSRAA